MNNSQILEWHVSVDGVLEKGHPINKIEMQFEEAARMMDYFHETYPEHTVRMFEVSKREVASFVGKRKELPKAVCPRGCTGTSDGRPIVVRTEKGLIQCKICGYLGE